MDGLKKYEAYKLMNDIYAKTKWPFFDKVDLLKMGMSDKILWALHKEGKVKARDGIRGRIVELVIDGEGNDNRTGGYPSVP